MELVSPTYREEERVLYDFLYVGGVRDSIILRPDDTARFLPTVKPETIIFTIETPPEEIVVFLKQLLCYRTKSVTVKIPIKSSTGEDVPTTATAEGGIQPTVD